MLLNVADESVDLLLQILLQLRIMAFLLVLVLVLHFANNVGLTLDQVDCALKQLLWVDLGDFVRALLCLSTCRTSTTVTLLLSTACLVSLARL